VAANGAQAVRETIDTLDPALGAEMHGAVRELYPIARSITGEGLRRSLRLLQRIAPLVLTEVPTGTPVLDWVVPREWNLRAARVVGPDGQVVVDAAWSSLHVVGYSASFAGRLPLEELQAHLHSLPEQPELVPWRTSYYKADWGFCLPDARRRALPPGDYDVLVDTTLRDGSLTLGEVLVPGAARDEVLFSAHCCHPSLANDNLSGMVVAATLARLLGALSLRYTYRFVFAPVTIGAIAWLALHEDTVARIAHGLVLAGLGDPGPFTYKRSRRGNAEIDRAAACVLRQGREPHAVRDFSPYGYDERQYGSPGFDLPVGALTRTPHGEYPEYHTSADDPDFVRPEALLGALRRVLEIVEVLEGNATCVNLSPRGEPQLGRRGLYGSVGGQSHAAPDQMALLWVLNQSDGTRSLLDVAERSGLPFAALRRAASALVDAGLLREVVIP
jgi:aminopeptidase-like protein